MNERKTGLQKFIIWLFEIGYCEGLVLFMTHSSSKVHLLKYKYVYVRCRKELKKKSENCTICF